MFDPETLFDHADWEAADALRQQLGAARAGNSANASKVLATLGLASDQDNQSADQGVGLLLTPEHAKQVAVDRFLTPNSSLLQPVSKHDSALSGLLPLHWNDSPPLISFNQTTAPASQTTHLAFLRAGLDARVVGWREQVCEERGSESGLLGSSKSSASLQRAQETSQAHFVRGKAGNSMFTPGGLDDAVKPPVIEAGRTIAGQAATDPFAPGATMKTIPPGFVRGMYGGSTADDSPAHVQGFASSLLPEPVYMPMPSADAVRSTDSLATPGGSSTITVTDEGKMNRDRLDAELDELLPTERMQGWGRGLTGRGGQKEWAHVVDMATGFPNFNALVPNPAHEYPFELDVFQKQAVYHLEQGDSVFVAAHTSAGKTVVAEYAIALAMQHMTRCVYTSPIKALSNQKFREFKKTFGADNVGILTGDVQINETAPCLIMTTEILRSMLYRGADLIRDVEFIIFDEVHYVNDQERGVVWEEVIILAPQHINLILLSATVPNTREFADWVGRTKKKDIYVISTLKRPVPLEHYLFASKDIFKVVDSTGKLLPGGLVDAVDALKRKQDKEREAAGLPTAAQAARGGAGGRGGQAGRGAPTRGARGGGGGGGRGGNRGGAVVPRGALGGRTGPNSGRSGPDKNLWVHMVGLLRKKDLLPTVVFVFSKKKCEEYASSLPNTDLNSAKEKSEVHIMIEKSLTRLKEMDRNLPQINRMRDLLSRGIGVHHGGLLPLVKEVVEILFQRGLVKVLFATETFAMGVNMPARAVVFSSTRKHDGTNFRDLSPGEYTQMAGRAGRRGLDATGTVIINASDKEYSSAAINGMILGTPDKLISQFRLTYNMILNLLRVEALKVEDMIKRSFSENALQKLQPEHEQRLKMLQSNLDLVPALATPEREQAFGAWHDTARGATLAQQAVVQMAMEQQFQGRRTVQLGRVVLLRDEHFDFNVGVVVKIISSEELLVLAAVPEDRKAGKLDRNTAHGIPPIWPPRLDATPEQMESWVYDLREVQLTSVVWATAFTLDFPHTMVTSHRKSAMTKTVELLLPIAKTLAQHTAKGEPLPEASWAKLRRLDFREALAQRDEYTLQLSFTSFQEVANDEHFEADFRIVSRRRTLEGEVNEMQLRMSNENLELLPDYHQRVGVLKSLRFVDAVSESVLLKGRVACEINTADNLVLTELILDNAFAPYPPEQAVALLSAFIYDTRDEEQPDLPGPLAQGYSLILSTASRVAQVQSQHQINTEDYESKFRPGLIPVVYAWAQGTPFEKIMGMTEVAEGTIVRCITRLDETCREVRDAARVIGDADLFRKMEQCQTLIRRDIVFAASLYF